MDIVPQIAAQQMVGLRGLVTVLGTLAFVGLLFVVVELIDRRGGSAAAPAGAGRAAAGPASSARAGAARSTSPAAVPVGQAPAVVDLDADVPADDVWPMYPGGLGSRSPSRPTPTSTQVMLGAVIGSIVAALVALALIPLRADIGLASIALALVLVVVAAAATGGRIAAAVTSAAAALSFNFLHTAPLYTFHIAATANIVTSILMIVIGVAVGEVAVRTFRGRADDST